MPTVRARAALAGLLTLSSCQKPAPPPAAPTAAPPVLVAKPEVLDTLGAGDHAWVYADGRHLRTELLPELVRAIGKLRADVEVGAAAAKVACGFDPVLAVDELLVQVAWDRAAPRPPWTVALSVSQPTDAAVRCLHKLAGSAQDTALDGRPAWALERAFVAWNDGVFVAGNNAAEVHTVLERMAHPEPLAIAARTNLGGVLLSAHAVAPNPFGMDSLEVKYAPRPPGSELELHARFAREMGARQAETIMGDGLTQLLGPVALEAEAQRRADDIVHASTVSRNGEKVEVRLELPPLSGQTALVSRLTAVVVQGVKQYTSWDLAAEARETVFTIARGLVDFANRRREQGKPARFPPGAPLVPDHIPDGKRVAPNPHAFQYPSWQDIRYASDKPTFYAVEFVTAKDAKSAVVRARGDIDGNGITSLFELDVKVDAHDVPAMAPVMRERDPGE